ncbi:MAG: hypothetical protein ABSC93_04785 [Bryobacteraceae bacterium]
MRNLSIVSIVRIATVPALFLCGVLSAWGQKAPLSLGTASPFELVSPCPAGKSGSLPLSGAVCYNTTISNCSNHDFSGDPSVIAPLGATIAVSTPVNWNGSTIFMHNGSDGRDYFNQGENGLSYAQDYFNNGFQVVQPIWVGQGWQNAPGEPVQILKFEACRPATLMNAVYQNIHGGSKAPGAMCAQGHSAGSAAMAYSLAWYGAAGYLADVVLTSGPVYANVEAGCQYPYAKAFKSPIEVCPPTQYGCVDGAEGGWLDAAQYVASADGDAAKAVAGYTLSGANCNNWSGTGQATTATQNQDWGGMSVVSSGASYTYPATRLYAFLCATSSTGQQNNSAAQGQLFYQNFTSALHPLDYDVYRVDSCMGDEMIWFGTLPGVDNESAFTVSAQDMIDGCVSPALPR